MSMKWFWKYALPAMLALVLPIANANAASATIPPFDGTNTTFGLPAVVEEENPTTTPSADVTSDTASSTNIGVLTDKAGFDVDLSSLDITVGSSNSTTIPLGGGFIYTGNADFTGAATGKDITVSAAGAAIGVGFVSSADFSQSTANDIFKWANMNGTIEVNDISVTAAQAIGVRAGNITGANIEINDITTTGANTSGGAACGLWVGDITNSTITLNDITVSSYSDAGAGPAAVGVLVQGSLDAGSEFTVGAVTATRSAGDGGVTGVVFDKGANGKVTVTGEVKVVGTTGSAGTGSQGFGLYAANFADLTVKNNISVTTNIFEESYGIRTEAINSDGIIHPVGNSRVTIDTSSASNLSITGDTASINLGGQNDTVIITGTNDFTNDSNNFVLAGVETLDVRAGTDLSKLAITGNSNTALVGSIKTAATDIGAGSTLAVDGGKFYANASSSHSLGTVTTDGDGKLEIYGNAPTGTVIGTGSGANVVNKGSLVEWGIDSSNIQVMDALTEANMSDAYLAAHLLHNRYTAWNAVRDHLISNTRRSGNGFLGQAPCDPCSPCDPCDPCGSLLGTSARTAWVNYIGRSDSYASSFAGHAGDSWKIGTDGVQVGSDLYRTKKTQFGLLFGYEGGKAAIAADSVKSDDVYVGFYGVQVLGNGADARILGNFGWQSFDSTRLESGTAYTSAFDGKTTELSLELGKRFFSGAWSVRPVIAFDYFNSHLDAAQENPAQYGAIGYNKTNLSQSFFRFGSDLKFERNRFALNSGLYYSYDANDGKLQAGVYDVADASIKSTLFGSKLGREVLTFNVGGSYLIGKCFTVFGGYQGEALLDADKNSTQHIGHVGGSWKW